MTRGRKQTLLNQELRSIQQRALLSTQIQEEQRIYLKTSKKMWNFQSSMAKCMKCQGLHLQGEFYSMVHLGVERPLWLMLSVERLKEFHFIRYQGRKLSPPTQEHQKRTFANSLKKQRNPHHRLFLQMKQTQLQGRENQQGRKWRREQQLNLYVVQMLWNKGIRM